MIEEITEFAMALLEGSKDIKSAISMLLSKIGKRFRMVGIDIREYEGEESLVVSYSWSDSLRDPAAKDSTYVPLEERSDIPALFQCPLVNEGNVFGNISYGDTRAREWTDSDKQSLSTIARVIGNYLAREHAYRRIERKVELMKSMDDITGLLKFDKFKEVAQSLLEQKGEMMYALVSVDFAHPFTEPRRRPV